jgi:predicted GH43/DUF377 family glycosyl hydrolase
MLFSRSTANPILTPSSRWWESRAVLNPGATIFQGQIVLVYRAVGGDGLSRFGIATSSDGVRFERRALPLYEASPNDPLGRLGVEDPRITALNDTFYLTYTKSSVETADHPPLYWEIAPFRVRSAIAMTRDFEHVEEIGLILGDTNTKDSVLFPEKIGGRYAALVREFPAIQLVTSLDLQQWSEPVTIMEPIPGTWEAERIGAGPPPLRTPWGWLLLYHANEYFRMPSNERMYRMGLALLDLENPVRVRYRHHDPIFSPEAPYEISGPVGNVVFGTGLVEQKGDFYLYYGAGDGVVGLATAKRDEVYAFLHAVCG